MNKSSKIYKKALEKYNRGYLDEAIDLCEESISYNIKNSASINLKGLLFYLKGDLEGAKALWKMNAQLNNDNVSKKYLQSIEKDEGTFEKFIKGIKCLENNEVKKAKSLLEECKCTDFNLINVNNYLYICYIKMGKYNEAEKCIEDVLAVDKLNVTAIENKKFLIDYQIIKSNDNKKKYFYGAVFLILVLFLIVSIQKGYSIIKTYKNNKDKAVISDTKEDSNIMESESKNQTIETVEEAFPYNDIQQYLNEENYEELVKLYIKWKDKNLEVNNKTLFLQAADILREKGVSYLYNEGRRVFGEGEYVKAAEYFHNTKQIALDSYLYPHILYMEGLSYEKVKDFDRAIIAYEEYAEQYLTGNYIETVLYKLTILYENININQAKKYGRILNKEFPKSQYNNSKVKKILEK